MKGSRRWYAVQRAHHVPAVAVLRFEVEAWARMASILDFDRGDRRFVLRRPVTTPHDKRCDCVDCTGKISG